MIFHIITSLEKAGAETNFYRFLINSKIKKKDQKIICLTTHGYYSQKLKNHNFEIFHLNLKNYLNLFLSLFYLIYLTFKYRPKLINTWMYHSDLIGILIKFLIFPFNVKLIWNIRCSKMNFHYSGGLTKIIFIILSRLSFLPNYISYNSYDGKKFHESKGYKNKNWFYLPNGIDLTKWKKNKSLKRITKKKFNFKKTDFIVSMIARNDNQKNFDLFYKISKSMYNYKEIKFVIFGKGTENLKFDKNLKNLFIYGFYENIYEIYNFVDLNILISYGEGTPNSIIESMSLGTQSIANNVGDIKLLINNPAYLINNQNYKKIVESIVYYKNLDKNQKIINRIKNRNFIKNNFSSYISYNKYDKLIRMNYR